MKKRTSNKTNVKALCLCAVMSSLAVTLLYLGSVIEVLDLSLATLASMLGTFIFIEVGASWSFLSYAVVSLAGILLVPNKFIAVAYLLLFGNYPLIKAFCERLKRIPQWIFKILIFNIQFTLIYIASKYVFMIPDIGYSLDLIVYILCNVIFVVYDLALTKMISFYLLRLRKRLRIDKLLK